MADLGVRLHALATWWDVLEVARARALYTPEQLDAVEAYLDDPEGWSAARE
jgi:orotate phosphoribosyltransferase